MMSRIHRQFPLPWIIVLTCIGIIASVASFRHFSKQPKQVFLAVEITSPVQGVSQLFYDTGSGYSEESSVALSLMPTSKGMLMQFLLPDAPILRLRLDPTNTAEPVTLSNPRFETRDGKRLRSIDPSSIRAIEPFSEIEMIKGALHVSILPQAPVVDPQIEFDFSYPLELTYADTIHLSDSIVFGLIITVFSALLCLGARALVKCWSVHFETVEKRKNRIYSTPGADASINDFPSFKFDPMGRQKLPTWVMVFAVGFVLSCGLLSSWLRHLHSSPGFTFELCIRSFSDDCAVLFWKNDEGLQDQLIWYQGGGLDQPLRFQPPVSGGVDYLRLDPSNNTGELVLDEARVRFGLGIWRKADMRLWKPRSGVEMVHQDSERLHLRSLGGDPQLRHSTGFRPDWIDWLTGTFGFWFLAGAGVGAVFWVGNHYMIHRLKKLTTIAERSTVWVVVVDVLWVAAILVGMGLPFTDAWKSIMVVLFFIFWQGSKRANWSKQRLWIGGILMITLFGVSRIPTKEIHEGHNFFLVTEEEDVLRGLMPETIHRYLSDRLVALYPPETRCVYWENGCWMPWGIRKELYAFSSESIWKKTPYSRVVDGVAFGNLAELNTGMINAPMTDFWDHVSEIKRNNLPFYAVWEIPASLVGWVVQWTGPLFWETKDGDVRLMLELGAQERTISHDDVGSRIWAVQMDRQDGLSLRFLPHGWDWWVGTIRTVLLFLLAAGAFGVRRCRFVWTRMGLMLQLVLVAFAVVWFIAPHFVSGHAPLWGNDDGLVHSAFGHEITMALADAQWMQALRAGENVFYFIPAMRYLRAMEDLIFGDTHRFIILLLVLMPVWMWQFLRRFMQEHHAWIVTLVFLAGLWHLGFGRNAVMGIIGLGEPFALAMLLWSAKYALDREDELKNHSLGSWALCGLLAGLAICFRPNYFLTVSLMMLVCGIVLWKRGSILRTATFWTGYACSLSMMPLHNWIFGGRFVPFTSSVQVNQTVTSSLWIEAVQDFLGGNHDSFPFRRISRQLREWIYCEPSMMRNWIWPEPLDGLVWMFPYLNSLAFLGAGILIVRKNIDYRIRLIAAMGWVQMAIVIALKPDGRYSFFAWDLCYGALVLYALSSMSMSISGRHNYQSIRSDAN